MKRLNHQTIRAKMASALEFLWKSRSDEEAWGDKAGALADLSGCAEVMFGMLRAGVDPSSSNFSKSLRYTITQLQSSPETSEIRREQLESARNLAWPLLMLLEAKQTIESSHVKSLMVDLKRFEAAGGGWAAAEGRAANTFDTSLVVRAFSRIQNFTSSTLKYGVQWLRSLQNQDGGYGFDERQRVSNPMCTSIVATALMEAGHPSDKKPVSSAIEWLRRRQSEDSGWEVVVEDLNVVRYGKWIHYTTPFAIVALLKAGAHPEESYLARSVTAMLAQQDETGGWRILPDKPRSNPVTGHALAALGEYLRVSGEGPK